MGCDKQVKCSNCLNSEYLKILKKVLRDKHTGDAAAVQFVYAIQSHLNKKGSSKG